MLAQGVIDVVILVEGEVGTCSRLVNPRINPITDKINNRLVCLVGLLVPLHRKRPPGDRISRFPGLDIDLWRLLELD
jgi:hypothetical protein